MTFRDLTRERPARPLDGLLTAIFDRLSNQIAGGRVHPEDLRPEVTLPDEGFVPEEILPDLEMQDWFDPVEWAKADPDTPEFNVPTAKAATGSGRDGTGGDWFRTSEAPNNFANRHNPLYKARADFAAQVAGRVEDMFGVEASGVNYLRPPKSSDAAAGGRSSNSDHYSAGAIDFFGTPEELDRLRAWAVNQPFSSFVRWRSESHFDHLHLSFDLGWVAENYFKGRQVPDLTAGVSTGGLEAPPAPEVEAAAQAVGVGGGGARPV